MKREDLTPLEQEALEALIVESSGNGHDFGIIECVRWGDGTEKARMALGALITNLQKKGLLEVHPTTYVNGHRTFRRDRRAPGGFREIVKGGDPVTQYVLSREVVDNL